MTILWIENSGLSSSEIRAACAPAEAAILSAGVSVEDAYKASLAECDGQEYNTAALQAWKEADRIALDGIASETAILSIA